MSVGIQVTARRRAETVLMSSAGQRVLRTRSLDDFSHC